MRIVHLGPLAGLVGQLMLLLLLAGTVGLTTTGWLLGAACGLVATTLLWRGLSQAGAARLGAANRVTLARTVLVGGVTALVADAFVRPAAVTAMVVLASAALVLDGVDGYVARRTDTVSALGARFDMEVDAFLILVLSLHVARELGPWVLVIGAARYLFVAAGWLLPWMRATLPPRYWRKPVAATQGVALTLVAAGLLPRLAAVGALVLALALLAESFGRDVWWLRRRRHAVPRTDCAPGALFEGARRA
jgi:phosphatidylglycerophosphate synthase